MALPEVVVEFERPEEPLCRFTAENPGARAMLRVTDPTPPTLSTVLTVVGDTDKTGALLRELRAQPGAASFEIVTITPYSVVCKIGASTNGNARMAWAEALDAFLETFGRDALLEPVMVEGGRMRIRAMAVRNLDTRRALEKLQELQKALPWSGFRVVRVADFDPVAMSDRLVPMLDPDQEELVRLALSMGYYESPRRCNLEDIARRVGLSVSPVHKKLKDIEHTLINGYLDPSTRKERKRRRHGVSLSRRGEGGTFREVLVHATIPGAITEFCARNRGARAVWQPLHDATGRGDSLLLVVIAPPTLYRELLKQLEAEGKTLEVLSRDEGHATVRVTGRGAGPDPIAGLVRRFGRDAYLKPAVVEGSRTLVRIVLTRRLPDDEVVKAMEEVALEAAWQDQEVVAIRDLAVEASLLSLPRLEKVTPRQDEVLRIGHALGYYRTPRGCTLEDIAGTLGISTNAVHKNLTAAEQKIIYAYVGTGL
ncbi:MAG TPA: helix-turn-helix domain-containing protein [Candidatus Thermoplasmatota archaeon]|nr:helix-turn-helix domain-containing protein [Candidatus Thermoplasmatota archaeon]